MSVMNSSLEVLFSPAEFFALRGRDLRQTVCVVFDVLRATSTMMTALNHGADEIVPVLDIPEALALRRADPEVLLAGERDGVRILRDQTGGVDFDLGNSPREFTPAIVRGKRIIMTTTNGTRALRSCLGAREVLVGSFLGLGALGVHLRSRLPPQLLLICAGTHEEASLEDTLAAGALADLLWPAYVSGHVADSAVIARQVFRMTGGDLLSAMPAARNGRRLLANPELHEDVPFCLQQDTLKFVARMAPSGIVRRLGDAPA